MAKPAESEPYTLDGWFALGDAEEWRVELVKGVPQEREKRGPEQVLALFDVDLAALDY